MDRLAIRAIHYAALGKAKSLLIKGDGRLDVGDGKHGRYCSVLFLVERINLLRHSAPFGEPRQFSRANSVSTEMQPRACSVQSWRINMSTGAAQEPQSDQPPGTFTVTVSATSGSLTHT